MSKANELTGQRFGRLVVLSRAENDKFGKTRWLCQCDCGNQKIINAGSLKRGLTTSCGCVKTEKLKEHNDLKVVDETGNRYGKLVVISRNTDPNKQIDGRAMWNCQCDCGNTCVVAGKLLRTGHVNSCGCGVRSKGEIKINQLLKQANLNFSEQYKIHIQQDLYETSQSHPYYFDFAIFDNNNTLYYLIEFDGMQHFETQDKFWDSEENFKR